MVSGPRAPVASDAEVAHLRTLSSNQASAFADWTCFELKEDIQKTMQDYYMFSKFEAEYALKGEYEERINAEKAKLRRLNEARQLSNVYQAMCKD